MTINNIYKQMECVTHTMCKYWEGKNCIPIFVWLKSVISQMCKGIHLHKTYIYSSASHAE